MTQALTHLGEMPIEIFLRDYWQKKPLLIRKAFENFESPIDGDELAGLALEDDVESRIIVENGKTPWELRHGPFDEKTFAKLPDTHWTLLVQAVDQWVPEVNILLDYFRFIPNWRLDDIMVSFAPDQGSVGPHFDYYDVFLLQGLGKRRWKIGQTCDAYSPRIAGTSLNILQEFETKDEWVLEPGDMLYVPPKVAHWGVAEGECMTYSIGFRAPSHADVLSEACHSIAANLTNDLRFTDPDLKLQKNPGEISDQAIAQIHQIIQTHLSGEKLIEWFGNYMTERKYAEDELEHELELDAEDWQASLAEGNHLWRHPASRFAFYSKGINARLFVDGKSLKCTRELAELLCSHVELQWHHLKPLIDSLENRATITQLINQESLLIDE